MGRRGPAPKPTALKIAQGNPGHRPLNRNEAKVIGLPKAPPWFGRGEPETVRARRNVWRRVVPPLTESGLAKSIDSEALARYVDFLVQYETLTKFLDENGLTYAIRDKADKVKEVRKWPEVDIRTRVAMELRFLEDRFGLTPSARSRIEVEPGRANPSGLDDRQRAILQGRAG